MNRLSAPLRDLQRSCANPSAGPTHIDQSAMTTIASIDAVVFDFGGVLIRITRSWRQALERAGLPDTPVVDDPAFAAALDARYVAFEDGSIDAPTYYQAIVDHSGGRLDRRAAERLHQAILIGPYPGVDRLVDAVRAAGLTAAVLSNTNPPHWRRMRALEGGPPEFAPLHLPSPAVASFEVGVAKPQPGIYRALQTALDLPPGRILFFDDSEANVRGAREVGWQAEHIDFAGDPARQMRLHLQARGALAL